MDAAALLIGNANWSSEKCVKLLRSTELFGKFPVRRAARPAAGLPPDLR